VLIGVPLGVAFVLEIGADLRRGMVRWVGRRIGGRGCE